MGERDKLERQINESNARLAGLLKIQLAASAEHDRATADAHREWILGECLRERLRRVGGER